MENIDYKSLGIEEDNYIDIVSDFFQLPIVKRALWELWNKYNPDQILSSTLDFSIENRSHIVFLRQLCNPVNEGEWIRLFLEIIREQILSHRSYSNITQYYREITTFILTLNYLESSVESYQSMRSILRKKVSDVIEVPYQVEEIIDQDQAENCSLHWFALYENLPKAWFLPIDEYGRSIHSPDMILPIATHASVSLAQTHNTKKFVVNRYWEIFYDVEWYEALRYSARTVLNYATEALDQIYSWNDDMWYLERICYDLWIDLEWIMEKKNEDLLESLDTEIHTVISLHWEKVHEQSKKIQKSMIRIQKVTQDSQKSPHPQKKETTRTQLRLVYSEGKW